MASITLSEPGRGSDLGLTEKFEQRGTLSGRARSAARHRERTEARVPTRRSRHARTQAISHSAGRTPAADTLGDQCAVSLPKAELVRQGNETIRTTVRTQGRQPVPFFCECSQADCGQALWLALADFDQHALTGDPILADGHRC